MKKFETFLVLAMAVALVTPALYAIPNEISGIIPFVNIVGMRFEEVAAGEKIWKPRAKLPGNWEISRDPKIKDDALVVFRLNMAADVFGIRASRVTAKIKDNQILRFDVEFDKNSTKAASLVNQLATNIGSFTGDGGGADSKSFDHKKINIRVKDNTNGKVIVTISPKAAAVATR